MRFIAPVFAPFLAFVVLALFLGLGLRLKPRELPSPLIDKPAPAFNLAQLDEPQKRLARVDMRGKVWLLNVWASWCGACREEHPVLLDLARQQVVPILGLNYKDQRPDAMAWLRRFGDPYERSLSDLDGRVGIDYGVYGVPETFVIDRQGVIRFKQIGPVTEDALRQHILPLVRELQR
jgi:cytochrome c biogenesis protein CcmG, thiol:disulfide interchange protein DsbE